MPPEEVTNPGTESSEVLEAPRMSAASRVEGSCRTSEGDPVKLSIGR